MKLKQLLEIETSIAKLLQGKLDPYVAYKLKGFTKFVQEELKDVQERRSKLLDVYGKKDADGKFITQQLENGNTVIILADKDSFEKSWNDIIDVELEYDFDKIRKINLQQVESFNKHSEQQFQLSMLDISNLDFMIEDNDDK